MSIVLVLAIAAIALISVVVVVVVFVMLTKGVVARQKRKLEHGWSAAAEELELTYVSPGIGYSRHIEGQLGRHQVKLEIYATDRKGENIYTRCTTFFSPQLPTRFAARRAKLTDAVSDLVNEPIKTGDAEFDKRVTLVGDDRDVVLRLATPAVRKAMVQFDDEYPLDVNPERIHYRTGSVLHARDALVAMVRAQVALADAHGELVSVEQTAEAHATTA